MFRLVKVLNANNQYDVAKLKFNSSAVIGRGCALTCTNGLANSPTSTVTPEYISLSPNDDPACKTVDAIIITAEMIFKVEYTGTVAPYIGMNVGISTHKSKMDAVTYNSSGKGTIVGVEDNGKYVYVRFRK